MSTEHQDVREEHGLFRNVPRTLRQAVERRLRALEADQAALDQESGVRHAALKRLYALLHIQPGDQARQVLFGKAPAGSARAAVRQLARLKSDPRAAAAIVRQYRFPFQLVESALGTLSAPVAEDLVETMEPEELVSRLFLLNRRNLLTGAVRDAVLRRLQALAGRTEVRFPYHKVESVVRHANLDRALASALFALVAAGSKGALSGDTVLLVDASLSMPREGGCLELAAGIGWRLDQGLDRSAALHVYLAGGDAVPVAVRRGSGLDQWRKALTPAEGDTPGTSLGSALQTLSRQGVAVQRLVVVTDGYENRPPRLATAYESYRAGLGCHPSLHLVQPAGTGLQLATDLRNARVAFGVFTVDRHLLGLEAFLPSLVSQASENRVAQVLAFPD
jgi:hypothetical protein